MISSQEKCPKGVHTENVPLKGLCENETRKYSPNPPFFHASYVQNAYIIDFSYESNPKEGSFLI